MAKGKEKEAGGSGRYNKDAGGIVERIGTKCDQSVKEKENFDMKS